VNSLAKRSPGEAPSNTGTRSFAKLPASLRGVIEITATSAGSGYIHKYGVSEAADATAARR